MANEKNPQGFFKIVLGREVTILNEKFGQIGMYIIIDAELHQLVILVRRSCKKYIKPLQEAAVMILWSSLSPRILYF